MTHTAAKKHRNLTEGPILPKILMFTLPLILTSILQHLFNTADTIVVGRWGGSTPEECETALAAVGSCGSLISLFVNFFMGFSIGAGICAAHDIGAKLYEDVRKTVHTSIIVALVSGTLISMVGICFAEQMLVYGQSSPQTGAEQHYRHIRVSDIDLSWSWHWCYLD